LTKILIIGAGVFGIHSAIELAKFGAEITLAEAEGEILAGTSGNSILRIHSGLHYPRDFDTAIQSQNGYKPFLEYYSDSIRLDFDNYYGLAREGSKSSKIEIEQMARNTGIDIDNLDLSSLASTGINPELLDAAWKIPEGVVDLNRLKLFYLSAISQSRIMLKINQRIDELNMQHGKWLAYSSRNFVGEFDFVVRATHGRDSIKSNMENLSNQVYEFHLTSMLEISSISRPFGMTVLDGEFISLLPTGDEQRFLVYGPGVSILEKSVGVKPLIGWNERLKVSEPSLIESTMGLLEHWFPRFAPYSIVGTRNAIRSVQSGVTKTDRRVTQVKEIAPHFFDIHSTKIDHVIEVGRVLISKILKVGSV